MSLAAPVDHQATGLTELLHKMVERLRPLQFHAQFRREKKIILIDFDIAVCKMLHSNLQKLEDLRQALSYKGWEIDFRDAEDAHKEREYSTDFPKALRKLKVKQKLHEGDRSHPRLVALDAVIQEGLTYPGWQADVQQIEKLHADVPYLPRADTAFRTKLRTLKFSQKLFEQTGGVAEDEVEVKKEVATIIDAQQASNPLGCCTICGDDTKSHAFIPCGHLSTCQECASKVMRRNSRCPVCRCNAIDVVQIYL